MKNYKNLNVRVTLHTALKLRATKNHRTIIEELDYILSKELQIEIQELMNDIKRQKEERQ